MKKVIVNYSLSLLVIVSTMISCETNNTNEDESAFVNPKEEVGLLHNNQLKYVLENFKSVPEKMSSKQYVEEILNTQSGNTSKSKISLSVVPDFSDDIETLDLDVWLNEFDISQSLKLEISKTFELFETADDLNEILAEIKSKELNATNLFQGNDLELYYEHLAVAKHTSIFWSSEEESGMNGIQYLNTTNLNTTSKGNVQQLMSSRRVNWWKVLGVDCVGGMVGSLAGYAGASAISVIMQL